jgi:serine/threonine protein kinase
VGISLIELALGRFPFSDSDYSDEDEDLNGTLAPGRPLSITTKKDRRKSKGVSLQGGGMTMSILELLQHIVNEPAPRLAPDDRFPEESIDFTDKCLLKDPLARLAPKALLVSACPAKGSFFSNTEYASATPMDPEDNDGWDRCKSMGSDGMICNKVFFVYIHNSGPGGHILHVCSTVYLDQSCLENNYGCSKGDGIAWLA